uniref:Putative sulfotransferase domain contining protein n=1 Tax=viral metagenome TaxID=1070528 RepID=A0A6M3M803_9ZZZZ
MRIRDLVVTGVCRSGTSLFTKLLNDCLDNLVATNEVADGPRALPAYFRNVRRALLEGRPIGNRFDRSGELATNSWDQGPHGGATVGEWRPDKPLTPDFCLATKGMLGFIDRLEKISWPTIVIVRDPAYTLGSWNLPKTRFQHVAQIMDHDLHQWWRHNPFAWTREDRLGRQAEYWEWLARKIAGRAPGVLLVRYEDLVGDAGATLGRVGRWIGCGMSIEAPVLESMNQDDRYPAMPEIRPVVEEVCQTRRAFGYA